MPPFRNFADAPRNYHLYTSEKDGFQNTDTVSNLAILNKDSGQGQKQTNLGSDGVKPMDNFGLWHYSFSIYS